VSIWRSGVHQVLDYIIKEFDDSTKAK